MPWCEQIPIKRHLTAEELEHRIKALKKEGEILRRLYFVKFRYGDESVEKAAERIGISKNEGYIWQRRWNEQGYEGLIPQYNGGRPSKLSPENLNKLKEILGQKSTWTTDEVRMLIHNEFGVEYTLKQIRIILKKFDMNYAKPLTQDYRRPENAEEIFKKTCQK